MAPTQRQGIGRLAMSHGFQDLRRHARQNRLLAALPAAGFERLRDFLEPIALPFGLVLREAGRPVEHAYFPVTGIVSLTQELASGAAAEVAIAGNAAWSAMRPSRAV